MPEISEMLKRSWHPNRPAAKNILYGSKYFLKFLNIAMGSPALNTREQELINVAIAPRASRARGLFGIVAEPIGLASGLPFVQALDISIHEQTAGGRVHDLTG